MIKQPDSPTLTIFGKIIFMLEFFRSRLKNKKLKYCAFIFLKYRNSLAKVIFRGGYNRTYSLALWQAKFYLLQQPPASE